MKFNKIEDLKPDFNKVVILVEKTKDKTIISTGYLKSIDINGCDWVTQEGGFDSFFTTRGMTKFNPQYWAEIDLSTIENDFNEAD